MQTIPFITADELADRYEALLFDAYGVLVHSEGPMPGAPELIAYLNRRGKPYYIVTNDASRSPQSTSTRYKSFGLAIEADKIVTSGSLLQGYFEANALLGARCAVLGTRDSAGYVRRAGGVIVSPDEDFQVLVVADESGFPFLDHVDAALTTMFRAIDNGQRLLLLLPNPDLIYSQGEHAFGVAAGSVALILEAALQRRYRGREELRFVALGKPNTPMYAEGLRRCGTRNVAMIGDQLETDIRGANACNIDAVLLTTGVSADDKSAIPAELRPRWRMRSLQLSQDQG
ncbi:MAG: HAD hydrolase-like protein [Betaproteobacteria bacterium]